MSPHMRTVTAARKARIIASYRRGLTLRQCAGQIGVSMQYVHQIISKYAPELMRAAHDRRSRRIST